MSVDSRTPVIIPATCTIIEGRIDQLNDTMSNHGLPSLLILPAPPTPPTPAALKAAYQPALTAVLTTLASLKASKAVVLQVYVPCPRQYDLHEPRSQLFEKIERLVSGVYSLICIVSAQNAIEPDVVAQLTQELFFSIMIDSRSLMVVTYLLPFRYLPLVPSLTFRHLH
jgi:hypothetical protein